jgi:hypothetical protein
MCLDLARTDHRLDLMAQRSGRCATAIFQPRQNLGGRERRIVKIPAVQFLPVAIADRHPTRVSSGRAPTRWTSGK